MLGEVLRPMSESNECYAYFTVVGSFDPVDVTKRVGVEPTSSWKVGELNPRNHSERKFSRWSLKSRLVTKAELEAHIDDVLDQLDAHSEAFRELSTAQKSGMQLVGYFHSYYPGFHLNEKTIRRLSDYGLSVDCDFYYLYSDAREDTE